MPLTTHKASCVIKELERAMNKNKDISISDISNSCGTNPNYTKEIIDDYMIDVKRDASHEKRMQIEAKNRAERERIERQKLKKQLSKMSAKYRGAQRK